jgi:hypothetical protein
LDAQDRSLKGRRTSKGMKCKQKLSRDLLGSSGVIQVSLSFHWTGLTEAPENSTIKEHIYKTEGSLTNAFDTIGLEVKVLYKHKRV